MCQDKFRSEYLSPLFKNLKIAFLNNLLISVRDFLFSTFIRVRIWLNVKKFSPIYYITSCKPKAKARNPLLVACPKPSSLNTYFIKLSRELEIQFGEFLLFLSCILFLPQTTTFFWLCMQQVLQRNDLITF